MRRPRLNALRTFAAAGRLLSFSRAAKELHVTQAAVSQQIRQLEAYLGAPLFLRGHRSITLTNVGKTYLKAVQETLQRLDSVTDHLFGTREVQRVVIRCTSSIATRWLAPHIHGFQMQHPDIDLHIQTLETEGGGQHVDIDIFVSGTSDHGPNVMPLLHAVITPVATPRYLENRDLETPVDLLQCNLIHVIGYDEDWHQWFATYQPGTVQVPRGLSADSSLFAIDAALRNDGILLGRRPFIDSYLASGELVEVFAKPYHLHANYFLRRHRGAINAANSAKVATWLGRLANPPVQ